MKKNIKIKTLRKNIDQIHIKIFLLILKRIKITKKIFKIKNKNKIKFIDQKRELDLIYMFDKKTKSDADLKKMFQKIQKTILSENKKYLTTSAKKLKNEKI